MTHATWNRLALTIPTELTSASQAIGSALDQATAALRLLVTAADLAANLATDPTAPTVQGLDNALQAAVTAIGGVLASLLDDTGVYVLAVPLPRKGMANVAAATTGDPTGVDYLHFPASALLGQLDAASAARLRTSSTFAQVFDPAGTFSGGSAYFVRTIAEALADSRDSARPDFTQGAWAYAIGIAGASDFASLGDTLTFFDRVFFPHEPRSTTSRGVTSVVPENARGHLSGRGFHAVVEWDLVPALRLLEVFDNASVVAEQVAIIRSTDFRAAHALNVTDLFPSTNLTDGLTGRYGARVVALFPYDGCTTRWVDPTDLAPDTSYFYHVAFRGRLEPQVVDRPRGATATPVPFGPLSSAIELRRRTRPRPAGHGTPPDWLRTPSAAALIPAVEEFLDYVNEQVRNVGSISAGFRSRLDTYTAFLRRELDRYVARAQEIIDFTQRVTGALTLPTAGAGVAFTAGYGTGGQAGFLADVCQAFDDHNDPQRPAFDTGDEYVFGFVAVAVGPDPNAVRGIYDTFAALFGASRGDTTADVVASIQQTATDVAGKVRAALDPLQPPAPISFGADGTPGQPDPDCAPPAAPPPPEFNDDFTPRT